MRDEDLIAAADILEDEGYIIKSQDIREARRLLQSLQQQLQTSQKENAALKVQVNEAKEALTNIEEYQSLIRFHTEDSHIIHYVDQIEAWCDKTMDEIESSLPHSLAAHDNEVIEKCENAIVECGCIDPYTPIEAIRNLKTEG